MSKKIIYLHIGIGKTGTTSIQFALKNNREILYQHGFLYPLSGSTFAGHHDLAVLGESNFSNSIMSLYEELVAEINSFDGHTVIISSENLCFMKPAYIKNIQEMLSKHEIRIIFFIREQVGLLEGAFKTRQRMRENFTLSINQFVEKHMPAFDLMTRITPWDSYFGRSTIQTCVYTNTPSTRTDSVEMLAATVGLNFAWLENVADHNQSILSELSEIHRVVNQSELSKESKKKIINELLIVSEKFRPFATEHLINEELADKIRKNYYESNKEFAQNFLTSELAHEFMAQVTPKNKNS